MNFGTKKLSEQPLKPFDKSTASVSLMVVCVCVTCSQCKELSRSNNEIPSRGCHPLLNGDDCSIHFKGGGSFELLRGCIVVRLAPSTPQLNPCLHLASGNTSI